MSDQKILETIRHFEKDLQKAERVFAEEARSLKTDARMNRPKDVFGDGISLDRQLAYNLSVVEKFSQINQRFHIKCEAMILSIDETCRPLLSENPSAEVVCKVVRIIQKICNTLADTSTVFTMSFDGYDMGEIGTMQPQASVVSQAILKFWENHYEGMPGYKENEEELAAAKSRKEQAKRNATSTIFDPSNEELKEEILSVLNKYNEPIDQETLVADSLMLDFGSKQKISVLLTQLVNSGEVIRCCVKGKAHYHLEPKSSAVACEKRTEDKNPAPKKKKTAVISAVLLAVIAAVVAVFFLWPKGELPESLKQAEVGEYVFFGEYEQETDNDGKEPIEWQVLAKEDGKLLLISRYVLEWRPYYENRPDYGGIISWEESYLRTWLNEDFYKEAFSRSERAAIVKSTVQTEDCQSTVNLLETQDKVFVLSKTEAEKYFSSESKRVSDPTPFAQTQGAKRYESPVETYYASCTWWLRTPARKEDSSLFVPGDWRNHGVGVDDVYYVSYGHILDSYANTEAGVRPVIWVDIGE